MLSRLLLLSTDFPLYIYHKARFIQWGHWIPSQLPTIPGCRLHALQCSDAALPGNKKTYEETHQSDPTDHLRACPLAL